MTPALPHDEDRGWRRTLSILALVLGAAFLAASLTVGVVNREMLDAGRFSRHVNAARMDPAVSRQVGLAITDRVLQLDPDLVALKPIIESTATTLVSSSALTPVVVATSGQLHTYLTRPSSGQFLLRLVDVGAVLVPTLRALAPRLAASLPSDFDVTLGRVGAQQFAGRTIRAAHYARFLSRLLPLLIVVCFGAAIALSRRRRRTVGRIGWAVVGAGIIFGVLLLVGRDTFGSADQSTLGGAITRAAWNQVTGPAGDMLVAVLVGGLLVTVVTTERFLDAASDAPSWARELWRRVSAPPSTTADRWGRAALLVAAGLLLLYRPTTAVRVVAVASGLGLIVLALNYLSIGQRPPAVRRRSIGSRRRTRWIPVTAAIVGVVVVGGTITGAAEPTLGDDPAPATISPARTCNGFAVLCDRTYNEIAFPATHNSMAAADQPGWLFAEQPDGILSQLEHGITGLLIDTWLGQPTARHGLVTTIDGLHARALAQSNAEFGKDAVSAALRLRSAANLTPTGPPEPYLCHGLCEIGSTKWEPVMTQVKAWMDRHPRTVLTLYIQDEGVTPKQTNEVFKRAGLLDDVYTHKEGTAWPTLGEMISSGRRLVVFMERKDGGNKYPWQMSAFKWTQDTGFSFPNVGDFNCKLNRGSADDPLLLVNHWLTGFGSLVSNSIKANAYDVLWPRVSECRQDRGQIPNFVAVNYYDRGSLFRVVDQLNGT